MEKLVAKRYEKHEFWKFLGFVQLETKQVNWMSDLGSDIN